jgi:16S rRNA (guanine527-N7)-methyltransferase
MDDDPVLLSRAADLLGLDLDPAQMDGLSRFAALLSTKAVAAGLVSLGDRDRVMERHVIDSLRAVSVVGDGDREALDLGSGAGLPGMVVAVAMPELRVTLVEGRRRRVAFLEYTIETLGLRNAVAIHGRIQDLRAEVDLCFARALAPLEDAWRLALPLLRRGGRLVYFAGQGSRPASEGHGSSATELRPSPLLESSGPLVIMGRQ